METKKPTERPCGLGRLIALSKSPDDQLRPRCHDHPLDQQSFRLEVCRFLNNAVQGSLLPKVYCNICRSEIAKKSREVRGDIYRAQQRATYYRRKLRKLGLLGAEPTGGGND